MNIRTPLIASALLAASLVSGIAHAVSISGQGSWESTLQGRDLDGNLATFEAYYDTVLDITWLANANVNGTRTWADANAWAATLIIVDEANSIIYNNWRLPNVEPINGTSFNANFSFDGSTDNGFNISAPGTVYAGSTANEMAHLFYGVLGNKALYTTAGNPHQLGNGLTNTGPFTNLQAYGYWSATVVEPDSGFTIGRSWEFGFNHGEQDKIYNNTGFYALAVSDGDVGIAAVPEPETYAMMLTGLGLVGTAVRRRRA